MLRFVTEKQLCSWGQLGVDKTWAMAHGLAHGPPYGLPYDHPILLSIYFDYLLFIYYYFYFPIKKMASP